MTLQPITIDIDTSLEIYNNDYCKGLFQWYPSYYHKAGYNPPWIGYWVQTEDSEIVGVGGFISAPKDNKVEIGYGTKKEFEGKGIASFTCEQLIITARNTVKNIIITAKTAPEENASVKVLKKNGFVFTGIVQDDDIGDAWEWILPS